MKQLLDSDYLTGVSTWHNYDHHTGITTIETTQDCSSFVEENKKRHNSSYQKDGIKQEWMHAATIPIIIQMKWKQELGVDIYNPDHSKKIAALLNDPEYRYLKTGTLRL